MRSLVFENLGNVGQTSYYGILHQDTYIVKESDGTLLTRNATNWAAGAVSMSDAAAPGFYVGTISTNPAPGFYTFQVYLKVGLNPALGDPAASDMENFYWSGTTIGFSFTPPVGTDGKILPSTDLWDVPGKVRGGGTSATLGVGADVNVVEVNGLPAELISGAPILASVGPVIIATTLGGVTKPLSIFQNSTGSFKWRIVDGVQAPVDLSGHTLKYIVHTPNTDTVLWEADNVDVNLSASDSGHPLILDTATVTVRGTKITAAGIFQYKLWDVTSNFIYGDGTLTVKWAPLPP